MRRHSFDGIIRTKTKKNIFLRKKETLSEPKIHAFYDRPKTPRNKLIIAKQKAEKVIEKSRPLKTQTAKPKKKFFTLKKDIIFAAIIILAVMGTFFWKALSTGANIFDNGGSPLRKLTQIITNQETPVLGENEDEIDILLLGIGGEDHPGAELTDTNLILSIKPSEKKISLVSIPRDMYVQIPNSNEYSRINKLNYLGNLEDRDDPKSGPMLTKKSVENITGISIEYFVKLDFDGFKEVIDALGGVEIDVPNSFIDTEYPLGIGYQTVKFEKGLQIMDGETALKFARSRKGYTTDNSGVVEGTDFARSRRQQLVIMSVKRKAMSLGVLANPTKLNQVFSALNQHIVTDMELWEAFRIISLIKESGENNIVNKVISSENLLKPYSTPDGASLLIPTNGIIAYNEIRQYVSNRFNEEEVASEELANKENETQQVENNEPETATIEIRNGTSVTGLAQKTSTTLKNQGLDVKKIGNADNFGYGYTLIYDLSEEKNPHTISDLESFFGTNKQENIPTSISSDYDIVVIIGSDFSKKAE